MVIAWVGGITALIGLFASLAGGVSWLVRHHQHIAEYRSKMALAQTETTQRQFEAALSIYQEILKDDPLNRAALQGELDNAMIWVETSLSTCSRARMRARCQPRLLTSCLLF